MKARLTESTAGITGAIVRDESTVERLDLNTLSMRGAQRQVTSRLVAEGFVPGGRWRTDPTDPETTERSFSRPAGAR